MIAQLNAELFETQQRNRKYLILKSQLVELEHSFRTVESEKTQQEQAATARTKQLEMHIAALETEVEGARRMLAAEDKTASVRAAELEESKKLTDEKNAEIAQIKATISAKEAACEDLLRAQKIIEDESGEEGERGRSCQREVEDLVLKNEELSRQQAEIDDRNKESELVILRLKRDVDSLAARLNEESTSAKGSRTKLDLLQRESETLDRETADASAESKTLVQQNKSLHLQVKDVELALGCVRQKFSDLELAVAGKIKELRNARTAVSKAESGAQTAYTAFQKARILNTQLREEVNSFGEELARTRRYLSAEADAAFSLQKERNAMFAETASKRAEVAVNQARLEEMRNQKERLAFESARGREELMALQDHAEVLEGINSGLCGELDRFVEENEGARQRLDVRSRVDYMKRTMTEEAARSARKLSPVKISCSYYG